MLRDSFVKLPGGSGDKMERDMEGIERMRAGIGQGGKQPQDMSPQEMHAVLWQVLSFRDSGMNCSDAARVLSDFRPLSYEKHIRDNR
jgi:hypothetical protein